MYRCRKCNSEDVEEKMWVNMNTLNVSDNPCTDVDLEDEVEHFCNNCENFTEVYNDEL